jgi:prephenate dehydrogenase
VTPVAQHTVVVGVGLIGASLALAGRRAGALARVVGVGRSRPNLERARALGAIDDFSTDLAAAVRDADLVVLAAPVDACVALLERAAGGAPPSCVLTDVASVKRPLVAAAERLGLGARFVGAHPMAGGTAVGAAAADASLFRGRTVAITPATADSATPARERVATEARERMATEARERVATEARAKVETLWRAVGASIVVLDAELHDRVVATSSHLPQMLASCLAALAGADAHAEWVRTLSGGGLRDTTRVAMSDPDVWIPIARANRDHLCAAMDAFARSWAELRSAVGRGDDPSLRRLLEAGAAMRRLLELPGAAKPHAADETEK